MSARTITEPLAACPCGGPPCNHVTDAGDETLYRVSCTRCHQQTHQSDDYAEVVSAWNAREFSPAGTIPSPIGTATRNNVERSGRQTCRQPRREETPH